MIYFFNVNEFYRFVLKWIKGNYFVIVYLPKIIKSTLAVVCYKQFVLVFQHLSVIHKGL